MTLQELASHFAALSVVAIGGVNAVIPEIHRQFVEVRHLITEEEFLRLFALSQAAPGPNFLIVSLVGLAVQGILGALVSTVAICAPPSCLAYAVAGIWDRFRSSPWPEVVQRGLAPITVGLVVATSVVLTGGVEAGPQHYAITVIATILGFSTRLHPLLILTVAGIVGATLQQ
jgi:chromate transporter